MPLKLVNGVWLTNQNHIGNKAGEIHGDCTRTTIAKEYTAWRNMRQRCLNPQRDDYKNYGGRGITICERWNLYENFLADMGRAPTAQHTLERVENDKGYYPDNCIWATRLIQVHNRRRRKIKQ